MLNKDTAVINARDVVRKVYGVEPNNVKYLGGGSYGKAVLVEFDAVPFTVVVKSYVIDGMHRDEEAQLCALRTVSDIPVPKVFHTLSKSDGYRYDCIVMEFMEGVSPFGVVMFKSKKKRRALALRLADCLDKIHSATSPNGKFGDFRNPIYDTWEEFYKTECADIVDMAGKLFSNGIIPRETLALVEVSYKNYDKIFYEKAERPAFVHGDLNVFNMFVDKKTLQPTAIIDPYNSMWADAAYDLFQFKNFPDMAGFYDECVKRVQPMEMLELRIAFYALFNEIKCAFSSEFSLAFLFRKQTKNLIYEMRKKGFN